MPPQIGVPETILQVTLAGLTSPAFSSLSACRSQLPLKIEFFLGCHPLFQLISLARGQSETETGMAKMGRDGLRDWGPSGNG